MVEGAHRFLSKFLTDAITGLHMWRKSPLVHKIERPETNASSETSQGNSKIYRGTGIAAKSYLPTPAEEPVRMTGEADREYHLDAFDGHPGMIPSTVSHRRPRVHIFLRSVMPHRSLPCPHARSHDSHVSAPVL